jgi:hypothetical protein
MIYQCADCKRTVNRIVTPEGLPPPLLCLVCEWLRGAFNLTDKERDELRRRLCK